MVVSKKEESEIEAFPSATLVWVEMIRYLSLISS